MAIIKITFDSASVTSKQDADLNHFLVNKQNGRITGILGGITPSTSNNYISFTSGYVQVYGRRVFVEASTKIAISLDGSAYGYVFLAFDLANNEVTLQKRENGSTWPTLTQQDLMNGGLLYELPIARYQKTSSSLSLDTSYEAPYIKSSETIASEKANAIYSSCVNKYDPLWQSWYSTRTNNTYVFKDITSLKANNGIIYFSWGGGEVMVGAATVGGSGGIAEARMDGRDYRFSMQLTGSGLYIETPVAGVEPKYVRVIR